MLETLAGRLKWERTCDGIRVVIPVRFSWIAIGKGIWEPCVFLLLMSLVDPFLYSPHKVPLTWEGRLLIYLTILLLWSALVSTGKTILTLNPSMLIIQRRPPRFKRRTNRYSTGGLNDLRFVASSNREEIRNGWNQSEIQFDQDLKTQNLAEGITEPEARALIDRMMAVYKFPEGPAQ
jgi:hypothetical protein